MFRTTPTKRGFRTFLAVCAVSEDGKRKREKGKMKLEEVVHPWPPNIHRYEQKFFGIPVMSFMGGGMAGIGTFVVFSQAILSGISGMIVGAILALVAFGLAILSMTPLPMFHNRTLPVYLLRRWQAGRNKEPLQLALIVSTESDKEVEILNWDNESQGVLQ